MFSEKNPQEYRISRKLKTTSEITGLLGLSPVLEFVKIFINPMSYEGVKVANEVWLQNKGDIMWRALKELHISSV